MLLPAVLTAATLAAGAPTAPAIAAAPRIVMLHGEQMGERRYMVDSHENKQLMMALSDADRPAAALTANDRPYVEVALFWNNNVWGDIAQASTRWHTLDPTRTGVGSGRLYLARDGMPPILVYKTAKGAKAIRDSGLAILRKYGVPLE